VRDLKRLSMSRGL